MPKKPQAKGLATSEVDIVLKHSGFNLLIPIKLTLATELVYNQLGEPLTSAYISKAAYVGGISYDLTELGTIAPTELIVKNEIKLRPLRDVTLGIPIYQNNLLMLELSTNEDYTYTFSNNSSSSSIGLGAGKIPLEYSHSTPSTAKGIDKDVKNIGKVTILYLSINTYTSSPVKENDKMTNNPNSVSINFASAMSIHEIFQRNGNFSMQNKEVKLK
jgi:hypothetical protein